MYNIELNSSQEALNALNAPQMYMDFGKLRIHQGGRGAAGIGRHSGGFTLPNVRNSILSCYALYIYNVELNSSQEALDALNAPQMYLEYRNTYNKKMFNK